MKRGAARTRLLLLLAAGCSGFLTPSLPFLGRSGLGATRPKHQRATGGFSFQRMTTQSTASGAGAGVPREEEDARDIWTKAWYPLAVEGELHLNKPNVRWLLGRKIVFFRDETRPPSGGWRAIDDRCPHRLAPMSMGRVDRAEGRITCRYHGYEFDGQGVCTKIPGNLQGIESSSPRNCVASFPTQVRQGLVWVWGDDGPARHVESAAKEPPVMPELEGARLFVARYFPVDWLYMTENSFDPLHAQFLHEGAAPMYQAENAIPMQGYKLMKVREARDAGGLLRACGALSALDWPDFSVGGNTGHTHL